ncbi:MAG: PAS domain-containing protein [Ktedonobacteraceae bacterium]|nr:PAS domain-containing protein [Ktedonobacteraceae bacterium]MBO0791338.1 PAS domain-containing protein [Ktedonobacteraceae bacterium]
MLKEQAAPLSGYAALMLEHASTAMALFDTDELCLLAANRSFQSLLEPPWRQGQALGHPLTEVLPSAAHTGLVAQFRRVIEGGVSSHVEAVAVPTSFMEVPSWHGILDPVREQGQVTAVLLTVVAITDQALAQKTVQPVDLSSPHEAWEREQQRLRYVETILLSMRHASAPRTLAQEVLGALHTCFSPQLLAFYSAEPEHHVLSLLASHVQEPLQHVASIFPVRIALENDRTPFMEAIQQQGPLITSVSRHRAVDQEDRLLALPGVQCVVYVPLWHQRCEGIVVAAFGSMAEATDLLLPPLSACAPHLGEALADARQRTATAEEQQRLHTVLDQLPEGIVLVEARTGRIRYANPAAARLLGCALPQLLGVSLNRSALLSPYGLKGRSQQSAFRWNFALIHALWGKHVTNQEIIVTRPNGEEIVVLSSAAPVRGPGGFITEAVLVFQDITTLKQLEQQKSEFFAVANHELRTPLTTIMGFMELLQLHPPGEIDAFYRCAIESITGECEHLSRLIHDLLDVTRLEYARLEVKRDSLDFLGLVRQVVSTYRQTQSTHRLQFHLEAIGPTDRLFGQFDALRVQQIVHNLLSNAMKYSPTGTEIEVGVRPSYERQEVVLWVKDQGSGIDADDLPHIFERFYRAEKSDRSITGFGIGLYVSRELVQAHGGRIWVESSLDQGSIFFVAFPLGKAHLVSS